jgi:hypothetical protein
MGNRVKIHRLIWDSWNEKHMLLKHNVIREEVEDVVFKNPFPKRGKIRKRLVLLGETEGKRLLEVVLENRGEGEWYPLTAYDALEEDRVVYERERGGEKDDEEE